MGLELGLRNKHSIYYVTLHNQQNSNKNKDNNYLVDCEFKWAK